MFIYFDIDGVLNTEADWKFGIGRLNKEAVDNFCDLVKYNNLRPVITSSWRSGFIYPLNSQNSPQIQALEQELSNYGIQIFDKTPITHGHSRDEEIQYHLSRHDNNGYIVLDDDMSEYKRIDKHNYFTDSKKGLTKEDIKKIKKMLRG